MTSLCRVLVLVLVLAMLAGSGQACLGPIFDVIFPTPAPTTAPPATDSIEPCAGCASAVEVDQEIVSFALAELGFSDCQVNSVRVENFMQQVVAGIIYSFDLVTSGGCSALQEASSCSMSVFSQPWTQTLQVNWDSSTCQRPPGPPI